MYRLMIVDDEPIERKAIRYIIEKHCPDVEVVAEAENGRMAIQYADEFRPDFITMDIKMPGIDGVEAVAAIRQRHPEMKCIMVSAYDTFDYARSVMRLGVREYLLKPGTKKDLLAAIDKVKIELMQEREKIESGNRLKEQYSQALGLMETEWVTSLLLGHVQDLSLQEWSDLLAIEMEAAYAILLTVTPRRGEFGEDRKAQVYHELKAALKDQGLCMVGAMSGTHIPAFKMVDKALAKKDYPIRTEAHRMAEGLLKRFRGRADYDLFVGIGTVRDSPDAWPDSFREALLASGDGAGRTDYRIYSPASRQDRTASGGYPYEAEKQVLAAMRQGDFEQMEHEAERYFIRLLVYANSDRAVLARAWQDFAVLVNRMLQEFELEPEPFLYLPEESGELQLQEQFKARLKRIAVRLNRWYGEEAEGSLQKAKAYIHEHFHKDISLEDAARVSGLTPFYFSKLFKEHFGITYIDYVTQVRIEKAKELLAEPRISLKDISLQVGYRDPNYFSRVFKKMAGMPPTEYRSRMQVQQP